MWTLMQAVQQSYDISTASIALAFFKGLSLGLLVIVLEFVELLLHLGHHCGKVCQLIRHISGHCGIIVHPSL
jgi:hypothetical protein